MCFWFHFCHICIQGTYINTDIHIQAYIYICNCISSHTPDLCACTHTHTHTHTRTWVHPFPRWSGHTLPLWPSPPHLITQSPPHRGGGGRGGGRGCQCPCRGLSHHHCSVCSWPTSAVPHQEVITLFLLHPLSSSFPSPRSSLLFLPPLSSSPLYFTTWEHPVH